MDLDIHMKNLDRFNVATYYRPLHEVGGDYFSFKPISNDLYSIIIADATGHGKQANLMVKEMERELEKQSHLLKYPAALCSLLGKKGFGAECDFLTAFMGVIDTKNKTLEYANAGQGDQYKYNSLEGRLEKLNAVGPPLGLFPDAEYEQKTTLFRENDKLILYTDGIFEIKNRKNKRRFQDSMEKIVVAHQEKTPNRIARNVMIDRHRFMQGAPEEDDACLVIVKA